MVKKRSSHLLLRALTAADEPAILDLWRSTLSSTSRPETVEYWRWKHKLNPFGRSLTLGAFSGSELVGLRLFMRWRLRHQGQIIQACRAVDTAVRSDWRRKGVFSRLARQALEAARAEGVRLVFNTPNARSRRGYLKLGWQPGGRPPLLLRPMVRGLLARGSRRSTRGQPGEGDDSVALLLSEANRARAFQGNAGPESEVCTDRSPEYLLWRYREVPGIRYRAIWDLTPPRRAAVIYRSRLRRGLRELSISEILLEPGQPAIETGRALVNGLLERQPADYAVACAASKTPERALLRACGFLPAPRVAPACVVYPLAELPASTLAISGWRSSVGDFELF